MAPFAWALAPFPAVTIVAVVLAVVLTRRLHGKPETSPPGSRLLCALAIAYLSIFVALVVWLSTADAALLRPVAIACLIAATLPLLLLLPLLVWHWHGARLATLAANAQLDSNKPLWRLVEKLGRFFGFALVLVAAFWLAFGVIESSTSELWRRLAIVPNESLSETLIWSQTAIVLAVIISVSGVLIMLIRATNQYFGDQ